MNPPPHLRHVSELDPRRRLLHVTAELHPGELVERGWAPEAGEFVRELKRPRAGSEDAEGLYAMLAELRDLGYAFLEGGEWSPAQLFRGGRDRGRLQGPFRVLREGRVEVE